MFSPILLKQGEARSLRFDRQLVNRVVRLKTREKRDPTVTSTTSLELVSWIFKIKYSKDDI